jgi:hypothetical protein
MGLYNSIDDEPDGERETSFPWRFAPFVAAPSVVWAILAFLSAPAPASRSSLAEAPSVPAFSSDPTQGPETEADPSVLPGSSPPELPARSAPASESLFSPTLTVALAPAGPALRGLEEMAPQKLAKAAVPAVERAGLWPLNDPDFKNCLPAGNGITIKWQSTERSKPAYLMVRQRRDDREWETWVEKTPVHGAAFTLTLRGAQARNSQFQWMLFQSATNTPPEPNYFCTRGG